MKKAGYGREETKKLGIKLIKMLLDKGFNEDKIGKILCESVRYEAYKKLTEKSNTSDKKS